MIKRRRFLVSLVMLFLLEAIISAAGFQGQWNQKPFRQWTTEEAEAVLIESPWAQTVHPAAVVGGLSTDTPVSAAPVTIRLRSALPVRQALARLRELKAKYDKMSDKDKAGIDEKNRPLLECEPCADYYIIAVSPGPSSSRGIPTTFQTLTLDQAKLTVFLKNEKSESRELVNVVNPKAVGQEAVFFFARFDSAGAPLISPASRKVIVSFSPAVLATANGITNFEFDVPKITANGQVVF